MPAEEQRGRSLVWAAGAGVVVLLSVLGVVARSGPYTAPLTGGAAAPQTLPPPPTRTPSPPPAPPAVPPPLRGPTPGDPVVDRVLLVVLLLLVLLAAVWVARRLLRHVSRPRLGPTSGGATSPTVPMQPELTAAVDRALRAVEQPAARDAVVAAWLLLGEAAAAAGTPPRPAETAAEYAGRLATVHSLPGTALHHLAELYRVARFSGHPVGEAQRDDARRTLTELRAGLGAG